MLGRIAKYRDRLAQYFAFESRPDLPFLRSALRPALHDRLAAEDSADRKAVIIGDSVGLARLVGLRKAQLLILPYPDFTLENLALLGDEYDFVIADRMLHRCDSLEDAARETMRVCGRTDGSSTPPRSSISIPKPAPIGGAIVRPHWKSSFWRFPRARRADGAA
jgi:hypothetical protein